MENTHPSLDDLESFGLQRLPEEATASIRKHVGKCRKCRVLTQQLQRQAEAMSEDLLDWDLLLAEAA